MKHDAKQRNPPGNNPEGKPENERTPVANQRTSQETNPKAHKVKQRRAMKIMGIKGNR